MNNRFWLGAVLILTIVCAMPARPITQSMGLGPAAGAGGVADAMQEIVARRMLERENERRYQLAIEAGKREQQRIDQEGERLRLLRNAAGTGGTPCGADGVTRVKITRLSSDHYGIVAQEGGRDISTRDCHVSVFDAGGLLIRVASGGDV